MKKTILIIMSISVVPLLLYAPNSGRGGGGGRSSMGGGRSMGGGSRSVGRSSMGSLNRSTGRSTGSLAGRRPSSPSSSKSLTSIRRRDGATAVRSSTVRRSTPTGESRSDRRRVAGNRTTRTGDTTRPRGYRDGAQRDGSKRDGKRSDVRRNNIRNVDRGWRRSHGARRWSGGYGWSGGAGWWGGYYIFPYYGGWYQCSPGWWGPTYGCWLNNGFFELGAAVAAGAAIGAAVARTGD
jgi:hypothetical protein